jgi:hypothetical protein
LPSSKLLVPWLALVLLLLLGQAGRGEVELGQGSRALARGGACVAWADDGTAGACNPAGPALLEGLHLLFGLAPHDHDGERLLCGSARWGALGLSGAWAASGAETLWAGAVAFRTREGFALGLGLRSYEQGPGEAKLGLDLGAIFSAGPSLSIGLALRNPSAPSSDEPLTRVGARLGLGWLQSGGELALSPSGLTQLAWGAEAAFLKPVVLRLGYGGGRWAVGLGFESSRLNADFAVVLAEGALIWMFSTEVILFREEVRE